MNVGNTLAAALSLCNSEALPTENISSYLSQVALKKLSCEHEFKFSDKEFLVYVWLKGSFLRHHRQTELGDVTWYWIIVCRKHTTGLSL